MLQKPFVMQINVSSGGVPKVAVPSALVTEMGIVTDSQNDREHHGGRDRALVIYSWDLIQDLQNDGHPIYPGSVGENLTISGLDWGSLSPGNQLTFGEVTAEITGYASPCRKISASFADGNHNRIYEKLNPGWSRICLRVLVPGLIKTGDAVILLE